MFSTVLYMVRGNKKLVDSPDILSGHLKDLEILLSRRELTGRIVTLLVASLGLIMALAWDAVAKELIALVLPYEQPLLGKLYYALVVTLTAAVVSLYMKRRMGKK